MVKEEKKIKKKRFGNYPFLSVIISVSLSLVLLGIFSLLLITSFEIKKSIQENIELNIYLNKGLSENEILRINKIILSKNYILNNEESSVAFISKEKAAKSYSKELGQDFIKFLGTNPLRDLFILKVNPDFFKNEELLKIEEDIMKINGVYEITYPRDLIQNINSNINQIGIILVGIFFILFFISIILINNTIKLALFSQRFLIRSMQLVGATSIFIQKPFLIRAIFYGITSGVIASFFLFGMLNFLNSKIDNILDIINFEQLAIIFGSMVLVGILIVLLSTYMSVDKYLKSSLDELY